VDDNAVEARGESRFVSNTAALAVATLLTAVLTLFQVKILSTSLLPEMFGLFAALRGFSLLISLLAANGFPQLLLRYLPFLESRKQANNALVLSGICFLAPLFLLTVLVFVVEANRGFFFQYLPVEYASELNRNAATGGLYLWFYACTLGVTLKLVLYGGLNGIRRLPAQVLIELLSLTVQVLWIYMWRDRLTVTDLFMILGITSLGAGVLGVPWYFYRMSRDTAVDAAAPAAKGNGTDRQFNSYGNYWLGATGLSLVAVAFTDVDRYLLSRVLTLEILSQFHIGSRVLRMANRFLCVPVLSFQPEVTRLDTERRSEAILSSTKVFLKFNAAVAWAVALTIWAFAPEIVRLVSSDQYLAAVPLLRILVLSIPLTAMTAPLTTVMKAVNRVKQALYCDLAWAVTYLCLMFVLSGVLGLTGVGIAQLIASLCQVTLAAALSRRLVPAGFVPACGVKTFMCGLAFAPLLAGTWLLPISPAGVLVKLGLFLLSLFLFRFLVRVTRVLTEDERNILLGYLDKSVFGPVVRRII
jgi:O-antigen/teichoic acid export membrane protein